MSVFPPQTLNELEFPILRTMWTEFVSQKKKKESHRHRYLHNTTNSKKQNTINQLNKSEISVPILGKVELHVIVKINMYMQK